MRPGIMLLTSAPEWDLAIRAGVHSLANPILTDTMRAFTFLGSVAMVWIIVPLVIVWLWTRRLAEDAILLLSTMASGELVNYVVKVAIHRPRPEPFFNTPLPGSYSFPSGHALTSVCLYATLALILTRLYPTARTPLWLAAVLFMLAIGLSRIYLGVHYPSDVLGGYLIGALWVSAARACATRLRPQVPSAAGRG